MYPAIHSIRLRAARRFRSKSALHNSADYDCAQDEESLAALAAGSDRYGVRFLQSSFDPLLAGSSDGVAGPK